MRIKLNCLSTAFIAIVFGVSVTAYASDGFNDVCSWDVYDPGYHGVGDNPKGFVGGVFDGRYVYFAPYNDGAFNGEVLRLDTTGVFRDVSAWAAYSPKANGVGDDPSGYDGGVFDGRYVYFIPMANVSGYHGEVLRYDTTADFSEAASWSTFNPSQNGVGDDLIGFSGGAFDGRYLYFSPYRNNSGDHSAVLRYDTTGAFSAVASWASFDAGAQGVGDEYGYVGAVFDGRYVYFVANCTGDTSHHGEFRRYDTTGGFTNVSSWSAYDPGENGVGDDPDGFTCGVFDGRYIYFVPHWDEPTYHGQTLRYDTAADFATASSWTAFDPGAAGLGEDLDGYYGAVYDGSYVYFVPCHNGAVYHTEVMRYDPTGPYADLASWTVFNARDEGVTRQGGYCEAVYDGRYIYFCPNRWINPYGQVLRFDTATCPGDVNHDGAVNLSDLAQLLGHYNMTAGATCEDGDLDNDEDVDLSDLAALLAVYGDTCD